MESIERSRLAVREAEAEATTLSAQARRARPDAAQAIQTADSAEDDIGEHREVRHGLWKNCGLAERNSFFA